MTDTTQDAEFEEGMEILYQEFKEQYERDAFFKRAREYYINNPLALADTFKNFELAKELHKQSYFSSAFLHAFIAIEVSIKIVALKPIQSALSFDTRTKELIYNITLKRNSLSQVPNEYFHILEELTGVDFFKHKREHSKNGIKDEIQSLQNIRNKIIHQGIEVKEAESQKCIEIAEYILKSLIPSILHTYQFKIEANLIKYGA